MGVIFDEGAFKRWLNDASLQELKQRFDLVSSALPGVTDPDNHRDVKRLLAAIDSEIVSRNKSSGM